jgi:hypothetical protein
MRLLTSPGIAPLSSGKLQGVAMPCHYIRIGFGMDHCGTDAHYNDVLKKTTLLIFVILTDTGKADRIIVSSPGKKGVSLSR